MKSYQHILLAAELIPESDTRIIEKAAEFRKLFNARLTAVHVVERISSYGAAYGVAVGADIEQMLLDNAKEEMIKLAQKLNLPEDDQIIKIGPAGVVILEEAERMNADLIIVGSHGRHGIRLLLGSTANSILHGAKCDVLAVRLKE
ncbi:MAG: universal stress protein [Coxiellaceae bacterium]|nr:MAG: universal stress protein [Coxiellaceae bacterium]